MNNCPNCGASYEPLQEYCLECGERLPTSGIVVMLAGAWQRRFSWYPGDWIWPVLVYFVLTVIATAAAATAASTNGSPTVVATNPGVTVGAAATTTMTIPTTTATTGPQPTLTTGPLPTAPGNTGTAVTPPVTTTPPATTAVTPSPSASSGGWPAGTSGYTNILQSIPTSSGRAEARVEARRAAAAGLPQTGVLDSGSFSSLRSGYYVVFSGVYSTAAQAAASLAQAHARGFPGAYLARVSH